MPFWRNRFSIAVLLLAFCSALWAAPDNDSRFKATKRFLYVQPGQTVSSIVKSLYPDQKDHWLDISQRLIINNPHAFEKGNVNKLIVGARLEIPPLQVAPVAPVKAPKPESIGKVMEVRGKSFVLQKDKQRRDLKKNSDLFVGDKIYTDMDGFLRLKMIDDASIELRCNSEMLIENYKLVKGDNASVIHLLKGSLHKVTGKIGKNISDRYEMRTPIATVGVRGTEYAVRVLQSHGCDGSIDVNTDGMFVKVDKGEIDINNTSGEALLLSGKALLITSKTAKPQSVAIKDGTFEAVRPKPVLPPPPPVHPIETPPPPVEEPDDGPSWWWLLLGIVVIAAL